MLTFGLIQTVKSHEDPDLQTFKADSLKGPYELKPALRDIFVQRSMIWWFDFVFVERFENLRDLPDGQDQAVHLGMRGFIVDHTFWSFPQELKWLQIRQSQFWILLKYSF